jgi:uncharacterized damage-inducible protein DinB
MKKRLPFLVLLLALAAGSHAALAQKDSFLKEYAERWENSRLYLLAVAEAMPESEYGFKPTPEIMSFGEQLMHTALAMDWHAQSLIGGRKEGFRAAHYKVNNRSKKEIIDIVNRTFEEAATVIANFDPAHYEERLNYGKLSRTKRQIFLLLSDHVTNHRAEMLIYLRLKGIVPPSYIEFQ